MSIDALRQQIISFVGFSLPDHPVTYKTEDVRQEPGYTRIRIRYPGEAGDSIPAYLLLPDGQGSFPAVLVHHQHAGQRHLGKSEICGLTGDPLQAFGPALVRQGIAVLAPDSICFEDRRRNRSGMEPDGEADFLQHFNEMCYRLVRGDTLMRKVLADSALGVSLLCAHPQIDAARLGMLGHSYGGNTVLFHAGLDERVRFACSSGAACTYEHKMSHETGIEMAEAIPGFAARFDIPDLVTCFAPRPILLVSSSDDKYSRDAEGIAASARQACSASGTPERIQHLRYEGGHSLTPERFKDIVDWLVTQAG
jgi:dienelactone hydrolase